MLRMGITRTLHPFTSDANPFAWAAWNMPPYRISQACTEPPVRCSR